MQGLGIGSIGRNSWALVPQVWTKGDERVLDEAPGPTDSCGEGYSWGKVKTGPSKAWAGWGLSCLGLGVTQLQG